MKFRIYVGVLLFSVLVTSQVSAQTEIRTGKDIAVAKTASGLVRGYMENTTYTFKGIPYATAKRFEQPNPVEPWEGIRSSTTYGPVAPLITPTTSVQDESEFVFDHD
ncbi:MAG: carboxylesterase family protein, partial [Bacteroidota bacterium]|nr:carboxylesterase family protein [Bacteroidota bacterium]